MDESKHQSQLPDGVAVLAFKSAENGFFFLCARNRKEVALQVASHFIVLYHNVAF